LQLTSEPTEQAEEMSAPTHPCQVHAPPPPHAVPAAAANEDDEEEIDDLISFILANSALPLSTQWFFCQWVQMPHL
jgi:hypothetical protein